mmetsp:Transcript_21478/g.32494  ORF Transcript_21478/g.32494 Transcript_21478/m.32494 type:complete len:88 (-) Transcript_21478:368-631(-)
MGIVTNLGQGQIQVATNGKGVAMSFVGEEHMLLVGRVGQRLFQAPNDLSVDGMKGGCQERVYQIGECIGEESTPQGEFSLLIFFHFF